MKRIFIKTGIVLLMQMCQTVFAASGLLFNVSASGSTLIINTTVSGHTYPAAGIRVNTPGYTLASANPGCTKSSNGYCLFPVSDTVPANINIFGPAGTVSIVMCLNGKAGISCQNYKGTINPGTMYVSDSGDNAISKCILGSHGELEQCTKQVTIGAGVSLGIVLNNAATMAYVVSDANQVFRCPVDEAGNLSSCLDSGNTGIPFNHPISITLNKSNSFAYVTDQNSNAISVCPIDTDGSFLACQDSNATGIAFDAPVDVAFNPAGTYLYVTNQGSSNNVLKCQVQSNGLLGVCSDANMSGFVFTQPDNIVINRSNTIAYITDSGLQKAYQCQLNNSGDFSSCVDSGNSLASIPADIILNKGGNFAYIGNGLGGVVQCPISRYGNLGMCNSAGGSGFVFPLYLALVEPTYAW